MARRTQRADRENKMEGPFHDRPCGAQLDAIHRISSALFAKADVDVLLHETLAVSLQTTDAEAGTIYLYEPKEKRLIFRHVLGPAAAALEGEAIRVPSSAVCAQVFEKGVTQISESGFSTVEDERTGFHTRQTLTTPIRNFGGQAIGVIQVLNKRTAPFDARDLELIEIVSALAATVIENAHRAEIERQAVVARAEAEKQAALSRVLGFIGHQLKNQAFIVE